MMMIPRISSREVQNLTSGARKVRAIPCARGFDSSCGSRGGVEHAVDSLRQGIAGETPGREDELAVGVEVDEAADTMGATGREFGGEAV